jgi:hypothetical protein
MSTQPRLAKDVLNYFLRNPEAADDLEGVARWRLLEEAVHRRVDETRQALAWLVDEGFLIETPTPQGPVFSLNARNREQAETLVSALDRAFDDQTPENDT